MTMIVGDCREVLATMEPDRFDSVVTDPPYEIDFMGSRSRSWDRTGVAFDPATWAAVLRVAKPGARLVAFGGTRTVHRMTCAIEDAGWLIQDRFLYWTYGSGMPKSRGLVKPAHEIIVVGVKPVAMQSVIDAIDGRLTILEEALWPRDARDAISSALGISESRPMDGATGWSIVSSWRDILDAVCEATSTFTTETATRLTTDLRTWNSCLSQTTPDDIIRAVTFQPGWSADALPAGRISNAVLGKLNAIRMLSAPVSAIDDWLTSPQVGAEIQATQSQHEFTPIVVARKPAPRMTPLQIDACRTGSAPPSVPQPTFNSPTGQTYGFKTGEGRNGEMSAATGRWPANLLLDAGAAEVLDAMVGDRPGGAAREARRSGIGYSGSLTGTQSDGRVNFPDSGGPSRFFPVLADDRDAAWEGDDLPIDDPNLVPVHYCAKASRRERNLGLDGVPGHLTNRYAPKGQGPLPQQTPSTGTVEGNHHTTVKPQSVMRWVARLVTIPGGHVLDPFAGSGSTGVACAHEGLRFTGVELLEDHARIADARIAHAVGPLFADDAGKDAA